MGMSPVTAIPSPELLSPHVKDFPLLNSHGIPTNFDSVKNSTVIAQVLSELDTLHKKHKKKMEFTYHGNFKSGIVLPIPRIKD